MVCQICTTWVPGSAEKGIRPFRTWKWHKLVDQMTQCEFLMDCPMAHTGHIKPERTRTRTNEIEDENETKSLLDVTLGLQVLRLIKLLYDSWASNVTIPFPVIMQPWRTMDGLFKGPV